MYKQTTRNRKIISSVSPNKQPDTGMVTIQEWIVLVETHRQLTLPLVRIQSIVTKPAMKSINSFYNAIFTALNNAGKSGSSISSAYMMKIDTVFNRTLFGISLDLCVEEFLTTFSAVGIKLTQSERNGTDSYFPDFVDLFIAESSRSATSTPNWSNFTCIFAVCCILSRNIILFSRVTSSITYFPLHADFDTLLVEEETDAKGVYQYHAVKIDHQKYTADVSSVTDHKKEMLRDVYKKYLQKNLQDRDIWSDGFVDFRTDFSSKKARAKLVAEFA